MDTKLYKKISTIAQAPIISRQFFVKNRLLGNEHPYSYFGKILDNVKHNLSLQHPDKKDAIDKATFEYGSGFFGSRSIQLMNSKHEKTFKHPHDMYWKILKNRLYDAEKAGGKLRTVARRHYSPMAYVGTSPDGVARLMGA